MASGGACWPCRGALGGAFGGASGGACANLALIAAKHTARYRCFDWLRNHARASPRRHFGRSSTISAVRNSDSDLQRSMRSQKISILRNRHSSGKSCCSDGSKNPISFGDGFRAICGDVCGAFCADPCESFGGDATEF